MARTGGVASWRTVCLFVALLALVGSTGAVNQCTTTGKKMCIDSSGTGVFTMYPASLQDLPQGYISLSLTRLEQLDERGQPVAGQLVTGLTSCSSSVRSTDSGGQFATTLVTCATTGGVTAAQVIFHIREAVKSFSVAVGAAGTQSVEVPAGAVYLDVTFGWPQGDAGTAPSRRMAATLQVGWKVPSTLEELWNSGYSSVPDISTLTSLPSKVAWSTTDAAAGETHIHVDGLGAMDMTLPHAVRLCSEEDAQATPATCWRELDSASVELGDHTNIGPPLVDSPAAQASFPQSATLVVKWTGVSETVALGSLLVFQEGQLGQGDLDVRFALVLVGLVLLVLLCCLCYSCKRCCTHSKRRRGKRRARRRIAPLQSVVPHGQPQSHGRSAHATGMVQVAPARPTQGAGATRGVRHVRIVHGGRTAGGRRARGRRR